MNERGTAQTQFWIITAQILLEARLEKKFEVVILDRSVIDHLAYATWLHKKKRISKKALEAMKDIALKWIEISPYNKIFFLPPLPLKPDGFRSVDKKYQREIHQILLKLYCDLQIPIEKLPPATEINLTQLIRKIRKDVANADC